MVIIVIGPSGSGKDTQANFLVEKYGIPNISTGRLMRDEIEKGSEFGKTIESYVSVGKWLPDDLTVNLLRERLNSEDTKEGFILNGYPRTEEQVKLLDGILADTNQKLAAVIHFDLSDDEVINRMRNQRKEGEERPDMTEEAVKARLKSYKESIAPILEIYSKRKQLMNVDASPSIETIKEDIGRRLGEIGY